MSSNLAHARRLRAQSDGLGSLALTKMATLASDGIHQAALGGVVLFSPAHAGNGAAIAAGFAVLLLPYSVVGPFASAVLDSWDRRQVLIWATAIRTAVLLAITALIFFGALATSGGVSALLLLSLVAIGASRLINVGLTAATPLCVPPAALAATNSFLVTVGSMVNTVGALTTFLVYAVVGAGDTAVAITMVAAVVFSLLALPILLRFRVHQLGPHGVAPGKVTGQATTMGARSVDFRKLAGSLAHGLLRGTVAAAQCRPVWLSLIAIGMGRIAFGAATLVIIFLLRASSETSAVAGVGGFTIIVGFTALGMLFAAFIAPLSLARWGKNRSVVAGIAIAAVAQLAVGPTLNITWLFAASVAIGFGTQIVKLVGDNAMQTDVPDARRAEVLALQDALFNTCFVLGLAAAAPFVPSDGKAVPVMVVAGALYALTALFSAAVTWSSDKQTAAVIP